MASEPEFWTEEEERKLHEDMQRILDGGGELRLALEMTLLRLCMEIERRNSVRNN